MKYNVTVQRMAVAETIIEVEAKNEAEAEEKAIEKASDVDFSGREKDAEYEVMLVSQSDMDDACDECGEKIPNVPGGGLENKHHKKSCSLYDAEKE